MIYPISADNNKADDITNNHRKYGKQIRPVISVWYIDYQNRNRDNNCDDSIAESFQTSLCHSVYLCAILSHGINVYQEQNCFAGAVPVTFKLTKEKSTWLNMYLFATSRFRRKFKAFLRPKVSSAFPAFQLDIGNAVFVKQGVLNFVTAADRTGRQRLRRIVR